ncbi:hypothetical protein ABW19_dt0205478 [Dactylella cylindrospora]|nr:hypothetical protein ABW19_dt0205478 [Dactylella cylindrospora]
MKAPINVVISTSPATASDPDIVLLARFEEPVTKIPSSTPSATGSVPKRRLSQGSTRSTGQASSETSKSSPHPDGPKSALPVTPKEEPGRYGEQITLQFTTPEFHQSLTPADTIYLHYYRTVIAQHVFHVRGVGSIWNPSIYGEDFFDVEASKFPPLFHAMMAVSAFSCEHRNPTAGSFVQSLQHYQAVLPALQSSLSSPIDLTSDGILYTHFFLLLYEVSFQRSCCSRLFAHVCLDRGGRSWASKSVATAFIPAQGLPI